MNFTVKKVTNVGNDKIIEDQEMSTMDAVTLPLKTTAERDALTPQNGWLIYNLDTKHMEIFTGVDWWPIQSSPLVSGTTAELDACPINEDGCFAFDKTLKKIKFKKNGIWKKLRDEDDV